MVTVDSVLCAYLLFGLTLIRCSGLIVFAPFFGANNFPSKARILFALFLTIAMYPVAKSTVVMPPVLGTAELGLMALQELSLGLVIGFLASLVFMGAQLAGELVGTQVGFSMANIVDPLLDTEVSLIGFMQMNLALVVFLTLKLHLVVISILYASYEYVGIGTLVLDIFIDVTKNAGIYEATHMMEVGVRLAMPVMLVMLLNSVVEGFITRTMPQMNIMVLGMPLRVVIGLGVLMFVMPSLIMAMEGMFHDMLNMLDQYTQALVPA